ncbi:MAG: fimbrillin family protein [Bacteroidales bacterium]|nr:fimbrillin family protein [Candidatus Cacconaster merdequi]
MNKILKYLLLSPLVVILSVACHSEADSLKTGVLAGVDDPVCGNEVTKALSSDFVFFFENEDRITVFPSSGSEYMTYLLTPAKGVKNRASFTVESFSLKDGTYYAMYPALTAAASNPEKIELSFHGQAQSENGSTGHLSAYDYCRSEAAVKDNSGYFSFSHKVAWVRISIPAGKKNTSFAEVSVSADEGVPGSANLNVRTGGVSFAGRSSSDVLCLSLGGEDGISISEKDTLVAYLTIPAEKYSNLSIESISPDGVRYIYSFKGEHELKEGHYYLMNVWQSDVVSLGELSDFGLYKCYGEADVHTWEPMLLKYRKGIEQISWYRSTDRTLFQFFELGTTCFASFEFLSVSLNEGEICKGKIMSGDGTVCSDADFKVIKRNESVAWLFDSQDGLGCIVKTGEQTVE